METNNVNPTARPLTLAEYDALTAHHKNTPVIARSPQGATFWGSMNWLLEEFGITEENHPQLHWIADSVTVYAEPIRQAKFGEA